MTLSSTALITLPQAKEYMRKDEASSLQVYAEYIGEGDGGTKIFTLDNTPVSGSLRLYVNNVLQTEDTDFTLSTATVTFTTAPTNGHPITANYEYAPSSDTFESYDDELLEFLINAATKKCEDYSGKLFIQQTVTEYQYGDGTAWLRLRKGPVQSITSVTIDTDELTSDEYSDFTHAGRLKRLWGWDYDELITIVYVAGEGASRSAAQTAVPDAVMAVLSAVAWWHENRLGLISENVDNLGSSDYGMLGDLPPISKQYLANITRNLI